MWSPVETEAAWPSLSNKYCVKVEHGKYKTHKYFQNQILDIQIIKKLKGPSPSETQHSFSLYLLCFEKAKFPTL